MKPVAPGKGSFVTGLFVADRFGEAIKRRERFVVDVGRNIWKAEIPGVLCAMARSSPSL